VRDVHRTQEMAGDKFAFPPDIKNRGIRVLVNGRLKIVELDRPHTY